MEGTGAANISRNTSRNCLELTLQLCQIPAPTGEGGRPRRVLQRLAAPQRRGDVTIDRAKNVICTIGVTPGASGGGFSGASGYRFSGYRAVYAPG